jgi:hypothetical protein
MIAFSHELSEFGGRGVQTLVFQQGSHNEFLRLLRFSDARKKQFLLFTKVWHHGGCEESQERRDCRDWVGRVCATV